MSAYANTSFLASLDVPDGNSAEAARRMQRLSLPVLITPLGELELVNAVQLRLFRKEVRPSELVLLTQHSAWICMTASSQCDLCQRKYTLAPDS